MVARLGLRDRCWMCPAGDVQPDMPEAADTDLIVTAGGDGTILRAARVSVPHKVPILGINMGRLGFMTELQADEALEKAPEYMEGTAWVEERTMLKVTFPSKSTVRGLESEESCYPVLNDVVVGRGAVARLVMVAVCIDEAHLTDFRADSVIVSTATGSTGYNLSVGGPILSPQATEIVVKAVAPHVGLAPALVLPGTSVVKLTVETDHQAMLNIDGYLDFEMVKGDSITVRQSHDRALFLRANPPTHFYETLTQRLGFSGGQSSTRAIQY